MGRLNQPWEKKGSNPDERRKTLKKEKIRSENRQSPSRIVSAKQKTGCLNAQRKEGPGVETRSARAARNSGKVFTGKTADASSSPGNIKAKRHKSI